MTPHERHTDEEPAAPRPAAVTGDRLLDLFGALVDEFPDGLFVAKALVRLGAAIGKHLPPHQRVALVRILLDQAVELGVRWN